MSKTRSKPTKTQTRTSTSTASIESPVFVQKHANTIFVSIIALLLVIFFHEAFFQGKVFVVPDNISSIQYEQGYIEKAKQDGINAFWNPYIFCGMPTWGSSSPGHGLYLHTFLDPLQPMVLLQIYGFVQSIVNIFPLPGTFWDIFNYFLLGLFTYIFGLRRKFEPYTAFIVAVSVVFSLYSLNWIMAGHNTKITVFAWLPAILVLIDLLFEKKSLLTIAFLVAAMHFTFNSGHVQMIFYSLMTVGFYILYKLYEGEKVKDVAVVSLITVVAAAFAFLMLSGPYFATLEYKDFSIRGAGSGGSGHGSTAGGLDYDYATNWSFSLFEIVTFFVPSFVGFGHFTYWGSMPFTESPIYLGIVICFLALIGILLKPKDKFVHFWIFLGFLSLLISLGRNFGVLYDFLFYNLPFFNNFRIPSMILFLNALCVGMMAGVGVTEVIKIAKSRSKAATDTITRKITKIIWIPVGIAGILFIILLVAKSGFKSTITDELQKNHPQSWSYVQQVEQAIAAGQGAQIPQEYRNLTVDGIYGMAVDDTLVALVFLILTGGLVWSFVKRKINLTLFQGALLIFLIIDWWIVDYKPMEMKTKHVQQQSLDKSDVVRFLEQDPTLYRILPVQHGSDNYYVGFGIQSVAGYHPAKMKYYDDIRNALFNEFRFKDPEQLERSNWALLSMLNAKYLIVQSGMPLNVPWLSHVFSGQSEDVYENRYVLPRAFFVGEYEVIEDDASMFKKIGTLPGYEPDRIAYLSKPVGKSLPKVPDSIIAKTKALVSSFGINSLEIEVETPIEAILKMSEIYYPSGWTATIDGQPSEILRTDYALRALVVPAGKHKIKMSFQPRSYEAGLIITTATNYILAAILLFYLVVWIRKHYFDKTKSAKQQ